MREAVFEKGADAWSLKCGDATLLTIPFADGCTDTFVPIEGETAWRWTRTAREPVSEMTLDVNTQGEPDYWMVPGVNYNGNGWGGGAQYTGYFCRDTPWVYAWHRVAIPACTYVEKDGWAVSLFGEEEGGMSCSIFPNGGVMRQMLLWPEQESPKSLSKRFWKPAIRREMPPKRTFSAILYAAQYQDVWSARSDMLDMAFRYFGRKVRMAFQPEALTRLDIAYFKQCWLRLRDGVTGFSSGMHWSDQTCGFVKFTGHFEAGWCGQNIAISCRLMENYLRTGDADSLDKALSVLDSWMRYARLENGLMFVRLSCDPKHLASRMNGEIPTVLDACNLGVTATYLFQAAELAEKCGVLRPEYYETALELCGFALRAQQPSGELAKSWFLDGSVDSPHGTVGVFYVPPLLDAWRLEKDERYLHAALKAFAFYYDEFIGSGVTTAGALDSFCIDKESAGPLLRAALMCHDATGEERYIDCACRIGVYLNTWMWHYSVQWPEDSELKEQTNADTYGGTCVSAAHNALDLFGLYYVAEFFKLSELTGNAVWRARARAIWYYGTLLMSDGTLCINGHVRPAGGQDESIRQTYWGRPDLRHFVASEWLTTWQGSYRLQALNRISDWSDLR